MIDIAATAAARGNGRPTPESDATGPNAAGPDLPPRRLPQAALTLDTRRRPARQGLPYLPSVTGWWVVTFLLAAFALQVSLFFFGGNATVRLPLRMGVYGLSLLFLLLVKGRARPHPAWLFAQVAIGVLTLSVINPAGDAWAARLATVGLYASILAPLLWVARLPLQVRDFRAALRLMWVFYTLSAVFGVLQVNLPGRFEGSLSSNFDDLHSQAFTMHILELADGRKIIRPMGLTDTPGGAGAGGLNAIVLGTGLLLTETSLVLRGIVAAGMVAGLFCIYIVQERTNLVIAALATAALAVVLIRRRSVRRALTLLWVVAGVVAIGTITAFAVGGEKVVDRYATLVQDDPNNVFQANRGQFLDEVFQDDIPNYPLGAGLGHWGMVNAYLGGGGQQLWAEMQWQAVVFDGGVPLLVTYVGLFAALLRVAWRTAVGQRSDVIGTWGGIVVGYDLAALAASFVFPIMIQQLGMEVVLLNACLYAVSRAQGQGVPSAGIIGMPPTNNGGPFPAHAPVPA